MSSFLLRFRSAPIRFQFAVRTFAVGALLVALAVQATTSASQDGLRRQFDDHTAALLDVVVVVSTAPLLTAEYAQHSELLLRLAEDKDVRTFDVLDISGQVVASSDLSRVGIAASSIEQLDKAAGQPILTRRVVAVSGEIGTIHLVLDRTAVDKELAAQRRRGLLSGIVGLGVLIAFSVLGGWAFTRRISDLESQLGDLGEDGIPNPVAARGNDEISRLGMALNQRTERIREVARANAQGHADLQLSEKKLQLALAATADAVIEVDLADDELTIVGASSTNSRLQGLATAKIPFLKNLVHPDDRGRIRQAVGDLLSGATVPSAIAEVEVRIRSKDRGWRTMLLRIQATTGPHEWSNRVLVAIVDVTEQRQSERSLAHADKMQAIGQLTAGIAHDFNNALAVSRLQLSVLGRPERDRSRDDERIRQLVATNKNASEIVRRLLLSAGPQSALPTRVEIVGFVQGLTGQLRTILGPDIPLVVDSHAAHGAVDVDEVAIQQVFLNLAKNALDAMQGPGRVTLRSWNPDEMTVSIQVNDNGPGIDASVANTLFEPFVTTKPLGAGTGLGLATATEAIAAAGGTIVASNNDHGGASFTVTLPLVHELESTPQTLTPQTLTPGQAGGAGEGRILVVEDNTALLGELTELLTDAGYQPLPASCVADAMLAVAASGGVDLILTDVGLPDGTGFDVYRSVARSDPDILTIFMSAHLADDQLALFDGSTFLQKPFDDAAVLSAVAAALTVPDLLRSRKTGRP